MSVQPRRAGEWDPRLGVAVPGRSAAIGSVLARWHDPFARLGLLPPSLKVACAFGANHFLPHMPHSQFGRGQVNQGAIGTASVRPGAGQAAKGG